VTSSAAPKPAAASPVDAYIAGFPPETRGVLQSLRSLIQKVAPKATEKISYGIPSFRLNDAYLIYFAGWKAHVSLYPVTGEVGKAFDKELKPYRKGKGTAQFPLGEPLPKDLIRRIVRFRVKETEEIARAKATAKAKVKPKAKPKAKKTKAKPK
jgi:uncharacterized protein YdhG (YjbR/CyaY superfamily)